MFHLGLNLRHPWRGYSGTPRNLGDRFVDHPPQQVNRTTIRLRVAHSSVAPVEALRVDLVEPLHAARQIGLGGFDEEVVVIAHQAVCVESPALLSDLAAEQIEKRCAVPIIAKDVLACISARGDVIQRASEFQTQRTRDAAMLGRPPYKVKH